MRLIRKFSVIFFVFSLIVFLFFRYFVFHDNDTTGPVISMEENTIKASIEISSAELLQGVTAHDALDGDVTDSLVVEGLSNFVEHGHRLVTIAAFDKQDNVSKVTRDLYYTDYESPQFHLTQPLRFPLNETEYLDGLTATDCLDGDVTKNIKISGDNVILSDVADDYPMEFSVTNSAGDVTTLKCTVEIYDPQEENKKPQFELSKALINVKKGGKEYDPLDFVEKIIVGGLEYTKTEDGDYYNEPSDKVIDQSEIEVENPVKYDKAGCYEVTISYTDDDEEESYTGKTRLIVMVNE